MSGVQWHGLSNRQPTPAGRKIYPKRCEVCDGKARVRKTAKQ